MTVLDRRLPQSSDVESSRSARALVPGRHGLRDRDGHRRPRGLAYKRQRLFDLLRYPALVSFLPFAATAKASDSHVSSSILLVIPIGLILSISESRRAAITSSSSSTDTALLVPQPASRSRSTSSPSSSAASSTQVRAALFVKSPRSSDRHSSGGRGRQRAVYELLQCVSCGLEPALDSLTSVSSPRILRRQRIRAASPPRLD